jgi:MYXO-CTERM domain-containing protein
MLLSLCLAFADTGANEPPRADAGLGLIADVGDVVVLNGSASADAEGAALSFAWTQVGGPEVELKAANSEEPEFTVAAAGTLRFELVVNDGVSDSVPDSVEIVVAQRSFSGDGGSACATGPGGGNGAVLLAVGALLALRHRR